MRHTAEAVENAGADLPGPVELLAAGHAHVRNVPGSTTACVAVMRPEGVLEARPSVA